MGSVFARTRTHKDGKEADYWVIEYRVNGKPRRETVGKVGLVTKSIARELLKKRELQVKLGQWDMIDAKIPTINEFVPDYLTYVRDIIAKRSWNRDQLSLIHLNSFFGDRRLSAITPKDIQDYQGKRLKEGAKPATVNRELACFKHLFNIVKQRANFFGENPVSKVKFLEENNQIERVLTLEEQDRLIANSAPHLKPIILTAIHTGMRKNEMLSLKWANVDLEHNIIIVEATNTKSKKLKRISINSKLRKVLIEQKLKTGFNECVLKPGG